MFAIKLLSMFNIANAFRWSLIITDLDMVWFFPVFKTNVLKYKLLLMYIKTFIVQCQHRGILITNILIVLLNESD